MIDALFGSKTRVKLLHLFLNNPGKAFYVREITRLIDEQINSVRRELSNLLTVGVITSTTADNKLFYEINQHYTYYEPFREIFADIAPGAITLKDAKSDEWKMRLQGNNHIRLAIAAGALVPGSTSKLDLLIVGDGTPAQQLRTQITQIEKLTKKSLNFSILNYDEFYYRLSVKDRFTTELLAERHEVVVDTDNVLNSEKGANS